MSKRITSMAFIVASGLLLGFSSSIKSFGIIVIIAFFICSLMECHKDHYKNAVVLIISIVLLIGSYSFTKSITIQLSESVFDIELNYSTSTPHYLLVGLNNEGEGQIHIGSQSRSYYMNILDNGMSVEEAREAAYNLIKTDWKNDHRIVCTLIFPKLVWAWQDDIRPLYFFYWMNNNSDMEQVIMNDSFNKQASLLQAQYLLLMTTGLLGSVIIRRKMIRNTSIIFIQLIIIGFFFVTLVSEAQSRYKYVIIPLVCIVSSIGFGSIADLLISRNNPVKR